MDWRNQCLAIGRTFIARVEAPGEYHEASVRRNSTVPILVCNLFMSADLLHSSTKGCLALTLKYVRKGGTLASYKIRTSFCSLSLSSSSSSLSVSSCPSVSLLLSLVGLRSLLSDTGIPTVVPTTRS